MIAPLPATLRTPRSRSRHPLVRVLRGAWTLPTNVIGHLLGALGSGSLGERVASPFAVGRVYVLRGPLATLPGAVTLGHAILMSPRMREGLGGRLVLAHELAHTRQHDLLGPLYLPLHGLAQLVSAGLWMVRRVPGSTPVHAYNPLEQTFLFLGHHALAGLARGERLSRGELEALLTSLGV